MASTKITLTVSENDRFFRPIVEKAVVPRGLELDLRKYEGKEPASIRMLEDLAYDVADLALSTFVHGRDQGAAVVALPIFTIRHFIPPHLHIRMDSGVRDPSELKGKRVGLHLYWNSMAVWGRHHLKEMHGVAPRDITWITARSERASTQTFPPGVEIRQDRLGRDTPELVLAGEVEAVIGLGPGGLPQTEKTKQAGEQARKAVRPAYPDLVEAQRSYYRKTGVLPMTNVIVMREELASKEPVIVESVCDLFREAKEKYGVGRAVQELLAGAHSPLFGGSAEEVRELLGEDPWPYTVRANRRALETFLAESLDQGLIRKPMSLETFFAANLPDSAR